TGDDLDHYEDTKDGDTSKEWKRGSKKSSSKRGWKSRSQFEPIMKKTVKYNEKAQSNSTDDY
ncbi:unnamed protein product, partial [Heterobilharzia americana]